MKGNKKSGIEFLQGLRMEVLVLLLQPFELNLPFLDEISLNNFLYFLQ